VKREKHVLIVGGGASGVLMACQLLKDPFAFVRVTLLERSSDIGLGTAYGTANPHHLLNVRASHASAYPGDPDHFWRWLQCSAALDRLPCPDAFCFVPRPVYGQYISQLLERHLSEYPPRLSIIQRECRTIAETPSGAEIGLSDGSSLQGDIVVLATGNEVSPVSASAVYVDPWSKACEQRIGPNDTVLILGTGLTMVDHVLTLIHSGHRGRIVAMSRRGLLSHAHRRVDPWPIRPYEVPFGKDVATLLHWFRRIVRSCEGQGGDWRSVVDGIRPFTREIWQLLTPRSRARFLRHARTWWDIHRHRMAPEVEAQIRGLIDHGRLSIVSAKCESVEEADGGACVTFRRRGAAEAETLQVQWVIDCRGVDNNPKRTRNPILRSLLDQGLGRPDPLNLGLEVSSDCAILDVMGRPSSRFYAIGPLTRPVFWEIIAVPDIRVQCAELAERLLYQVPVARAAARRG
jgi:uncharacterized NAD(P)/FAD-binding protein YdhS